MKSISALLVSTVSDWTEVWLVAFSAFSDGDFDEVLDGVSDGGWFDWSGAGAWATGAWADSVDFVIAFGVFEVGVGDFGDRDLVIIRTNISAHLISSH